MQIIIKEQDKVRINKLIDWTLYFIGYTIVFILATSLFNSIVIDNNHLIIWSIVIVFITYLLNFLFNIQPAVSNEFLVA